MDNAMMNKANRIAEMVKANGINVSVGTKNDNGVERIGFALGDGDIRPMLYPNMETNNLDEIADYLIKGYEDTKDAGNDFRNATDNYTNFDLAKDNIIPVLVRECQDDVVSRNYLDLKVMYRYIIPNQSASIVVKEDILKIWDKTEEDIYNLALNNVRDTFMDTSIEEMLGFPTSTETGMRVISTASKNYGAAALLFPEIFEKYGNDARILPSSIHELIVVSDMGNNPSDNVLVDMIMTVNANELRPEEILSNHPYRYENGEIKEVV